jgi:hypothetical protein
MLAIEAKVGMTVDPGAVRTLGAAVQAWGDLKVNQFIVFGGNDGMKIHGCVLLPWRKVAGIIKAPPRKSL